MIYEEEKDYIMRIIKEMARVLFYEYVSEKGEDFLKVHNYSLEEAYEGMKQLAENAGYGWVNEE